MNRLVSVSSWIGTALMGAAPFLITTALGQVMAMLGLALLSLQALEKKCYNLILLNTIGAFGYAINLYI